MIFKFNRQGPIKIKSFKYDNEYIEVVKEFEYLGLIIFDTLGFESMTCKVVSSANLAIKSCVRIITVSKAENWST